MGAVYFIASYDITDPDRYERDYVPDVARTLADAGGEILVASGSGGSLEGNPPGQTVVFRFSTERAFHDWYDGDDYQALHQLRLETTRNNSAVVVDEFPSTQTPP